MGKMKEGTTSFGGPISQTLKDVIDAQCDKTELPMGRIVKSLAEFWAGLQPEEQKLLCYGVNNLTLGDFVLSRVKVFLSSPEGLTLLDEAFAQRAAPMLRRKGLERHRSAKTR